MEYPIRIAQIMGKMNNGGVESIVMNYYRNIDRSKIQFDFIIDSDSKCPQKEEITALGGRVYFIPPYKNIFSYSKALRKIFTQNKYLIVHSQITTLNVFSLKVAKECNIPVRISHSHSTAGRKEYLKNILKRFLKIYSKKYATHFFSCGEYAGRWLFGKKLYNEGKVTVINNAIDINLFKYSESIRKKLREELNLSENDFVIGHIGRFVPQKNHIFLLKVFSHFHKEYNNLKMIFIGEGPLEDKMKKVAYKLNLNNSVFFLGSKSDVNEYYNVIDLFALPSLYEGLPVVGIEAQCNGLPCLFSDKMTDEILINENVKKVQLKKDKWNLCNNFTRTNNTKVNYKYDIVKESKVLSNLYLSLIKYDSIND